MSGSGTTAAALLAALGVVALLRPAASQAGSFPVPQTCRAEEFFDTAGVTCSSCIIDASPDTSVQEGGYTTKCKCNGGTFLSFSSTAAEEPLNLGTCTPCSPGTVPSASGEYCVLCDGTTGDGWTPARINDAGTGCECATSTPTSTITDIGLGGALLRQGNGSFIHRCIKCPTGSYPDPLGLRCVRCMYPMFWDGDRCACPPPDQLPEGSRCTLTTDAWENIIQRGAINYEVSFEVEDSGFQRVLAVDRSKVMVDMLDKAAHGCLEYGNTTACNALGNLCVLQMHDLEASACSLYRELVDLRQDEPYLESLLGEVGWSLTMPWLYYPANQANQFLLATNVKSRVKLEGDNDGTRAEPQVRLLNFKMARYKLDGTFLGWKNFTTQLQLCGGKVKQLDRWRFFGTDYRNNRTAVHSTKSFVCFPTSPNIPGFCPCQHASFTWEEMNKCELPLDTILSIGEETLEPVFVDLYFEDGPDVMYPVPIILENMNTIAEDEDLTQAVGLQLTRRFFLVDSKSGREESSDPSSQPTAVRYLEKFFLEVIVQENNNRVGENGRIYPPRLTIRYTSRDPKLSGQAGVTNPAEFRVSYSMDKGKMEEFINAWDYMIIAAMMAAILVGLAKAWRILKNRGRSSDKSSGGDYEMIADLTIVAADVASAAVFFVLFAICVYWLCFYKLQASVYTILPADEGAIWYRFRVSLMCAVVGRVASVLWMVWKQTCVDIFLIDWTEPQDLVNDKDMTVEKAPVSCWRSLFVANEWNELQTLRITSLEVTMFFAIFLLSGVSLEEGAKVSADEGDLEDRDVDMSSQMLRFGISASIFTLIEIAQILFKVLVVYYRIGDPMVDFVDLCWLSNISMIILDNCSGFYIHGQFTGKYVDTDARTLNRELLQPHNDMRGFIHGNEDQVQTFMIFVTSDLRDTYDDYLRRINDKYHKQRTDHGNFDYLLYGPKNAGEPDLQKEADELRKQLMKELLEIQREPTKRVLEPGLANKWLKIPPDEVKTVFWKDRHKSFTEVMFYGNELSLFMMQVLVFTAIDMRVRNAAFSGSITYLVMCTLGYLRREWGENNLSQKSMVDKKFLI